jgi:hypothetical protein
MEEEEGEPEEEGKRKEWTTGSAAAARRRKIEEVGKEDGCIPCCFLTTCNDLCSWYVCDGFVSRPVWGSGKSCHCEDVPSHGFNRDVVYLRAPAGSLPSLFPLHHTFPPANDHFHAPYTTSIYQRAQLIIWQTIQACESTTSTHFRAA